MIPYIPHQIFHYYCSFLQILSPYTEANATINYVCVYVCVCNRKMANCLYPRDYAHVFCSYSALRKAH